MLRPRPPKGCGAELSKKHPSDVARSEGVHRLPQQHTRNYKPTGENNCATDNITDHLRDLQGIAVRPADTAAREGAKPLIVRQRVHRRNSESGLESV